MDMTTFIDLLDDIFEALAPFLSPGSLYCLLGVSEHMRSIYSSHMLRNNDLLKKHKHFKLSPFLLDILSDAFSIDSVGLFYYFKCIQVIPNMKIWKDLIAHNTIKSGALNILRYIYRKKDPKYNRLANTIIKYGQLKILQWLSKYKPNRDYESEYNAAFKYRQLEILEWIDMNNHPYTSINWVKLLNVDH